MAAVAKLLSLIAVSWLSLAPPAIADASILKGLPPSGFGITIEPLDPDARKAGLSEAGLKKVIESRMAKRNVLVINTGHAELYVRIVTLTSNDVAGKVLGYGSHVELSFREKAILKRDKVTEFMAPVWFKGAVAVANPKSIVGEVVHALASLTEQFLNDYQHVNPR